MVSATKLIETIFLISIFLIQVSDGPHKKDQAIGSL